MTSDTHNKYVYDAHINSTFIASYVDGGLCTYNVTVYTIYTRIYDMWYGVRPLIRYTKVSSYDQHTPNGDKITCTPNLFQKSVDMPAPLIWKLERVSVDVEKNRCSKLFT